MRTFTLTLPDGQYYAGYTGSVRDNLAGRLTLWRADSGARIVQLENFRSGDFGIVLGTAAPARSYTDIAGTQQADNGELGDTMAHQDTLRTNASLQRVYGNGGKGNCDGALYRKKSQSPRYGEHTAANDCAWRRTA